MNFKKRIYKLSAYILAYCPISFVLFWSNRKLIPYDRTKRGKKVLVLDADRFRDDLRGISLFSNLELICMPVQLQDFLSKVVYYRNCGPKGSQIQDYDLSFLTRYLAGLKDQSNYWGVVSAGFFYRRNEEWEISCRRVKLPFVCLHRESVGEEPRSLERLQFPSTLRHFRGQAIFVGTEGYRDALQRSDHSNRARVVATGLPRFDCVFHLRGKPESSETRKSIVLFSFLPATLLDAVIERYGHHTENGFKELFYSVHSSIGYLAREYSHVDFKIKPKWYSGSWKRYIDRAVYQIAEVSPSDQRNVQISDHWSAQDLIQEASLVVAFNSTTMVESVLMGKPTVAPWYAEAADKYRGQILYKDYSEAFLVADSQEKLRLLIKAHVENGFSTKQDPKRLIRDVVGRFDGKCASRIEGELDTLNSELRE